MNLVGESRTFSSYKQMLEVISENYNELRKRTKREPFKGYNNFQEILLECSSHEEWTYKEIMDFEKNLLGSINIESIIPKKLLDKLESKNIKSLDEYEKKDLYWFMVVEAVPKLTKNKKPYFLLNAISSSGKVFKIFCWGVSSSAVLDPYTFCVGEIDQNDFGMSTKWFKIKSFNL